MYPEGKRIHVSHFSDSAMQLWAANPPEIEKHYRSVETVHVIEKSRQYLICIALANFGPSLFISLPDQFFKRIDVTSINVDKQKMVKWSGQCQVRSGQNR